MEIVKEIAWGLVDYVKAPDAKKFVKYADKYTLKSHQKVRIEDLL